MKKILFLLILLTGGLTWASAQDATTLQVAPSDQVIYPDASQILNKTETKTTAKAVPGSTAGLPTSKPLVAAVPVAAKTGAVAAKPAESAHGWFLKWTIPGDEAAAQAWATGLGREVRVIPAGDGLWEVLQGPLAADALKEALGGQAGKASLVKR